MKKILILLYLFTLPAQARLVLDGHIGYGISNNFETTGVKDVSYDGAVLGARIGVSLFSFILVGGDLSYSDNKFEYTDTTTDIGYKIPAPRLDYGIFFGFELPIMLRFWGSYYLKSDLQIKDQFGTELEGKAYGVGVGWTLLPFVSINGEYRMYEYNQSTGSNSDLPPLSDDNTLKGNWFLLSIGVYANLF